MSTASDPVAEAALENVDTLSGNRITNGLAGEAVARKRQSSGIFQTKFFLPISPPPL